MYRVKLFPILLSGLLLLGCTPAAPTAQETIMPPQRIVSLAPNITEMLFALGLGERVVGVTTYCNYPPEARKIPKVGDFANCELERIIALKPDLVIATRDGNPAEVVAKLRELAITVRLADAYRIEEIYTTITGIGKWTGMEEKAAGLVQDLRRRIQELQKSVKNLRRPRTLLVYGFEPLIVAGTGSLGHQLLQLAGAANAVTSMAAYLQPSMETIIKLAPGVIIDVAHGIEDEGRAKRHWQRWRSIPAVRDNRIYSLNPDLLTRPGPRIARAVELLAEVIHPELVEREKDAEK